LEEAWHRKVADLKQVEIPENCEQLYEGTIFKASNNCLEQRCIVRSGPTKIPEVQAARDAFFNQPIYKARGIEDKFAFDNDDLTRWYTPAIQYGMLRIDIGEVTDVREGDAFVIKGSEDDFYDTTQFTLEISSDLSKWTSISTEIKECKKGTPASSNEKIYYETPEDPENPFDASKDPRFFGESRFPYPVGEQKYLEFTLPKTQFRYARLNKTPLWVLDVNLKREGKLATNRNKWKGNYMFPNLHDVPVKSAWKASFILSEIPRNSYLCIAINGEHGQERAFATLSVDGGELLIGASKRAPSYPGHPWEHSIAGTNENYTYFFPLTDSLRGKSIDAFVLVLQDLKEDITPEIWITAYPAPYSKKVLKVE